MLIVGLENGTTPNMDIREVPRDIQEENEHYQIMKNVTNNEVPFGDKTSSLYLTEIKEGEIIL